MTLEAARVSEEGFGSLRGCLVEGDPQAEKRARRIKQRAVAISVVLQTFVLTALVLYPLLSKGERISLKDMTPIPPYPHLSTRHTQPRPDGPKVPAICRFCAPNHIPPAVPIVDVEHILEPGEPDGDQIPGLPVVPGVDHSFPTADMRPAPPPVERQSEKRKPYIVSEIQQMAQLIERVDPVYPPLARQIHREGRVEVHAIISVEGRIESLEVISGDPFFIQSALAAVRQWRYRPTILNGRPVEVDTHITVIYTLSH